MPHLRVKGLEALAVAERSKELVDGLAKIIECDRNWFTIEILESKFIFDGKDVQSPIFVEIYWFDRGQEIKDRVAEFIESILIEIDGERDRTVIFNDLKGTDYYENGKHF